MFARLTLFTQATLATLAVLLAAPGLVRAQTYPGLSDARIAQIAQMLPVQPASFGVPCSDRAAWEPVARDFQSSVEQAERFIASPLPPWNDDAYQLYYKTGDRKTGESMMHAHDGQLGPLVLAECAEWKGRFLPRIEEELDALSAQRSWVEPAHTMHRVDLNAASQAHVVAEALYLLGDKLPADVRQRAMAGLDSHVFGFMMQSFKGIHPDSWLHVHSNWNSVCLDGTVGAALAVLPSREDRALYVAAAEHFSPNYLFSFKDSGYDEEGIGYWVYGFSNYVELRQEIWQATSGKLDFFDTPKARKAALFGFQFAMMPGVYASFADAHFGSRPDPNLLAAINSIFQLGMGSTLEPPRRSPFEGALPEAVLAAFPLHSQWKGNGEGSSSDLIGIRTYYADAGVLVDRPVPGGDLAITIKDDGNGPHSHNDIGAYAIGLNGTQPLGDPGGPSYYTADTFSRRRLESKLINSWGHPVPEVDGTLQLDATRVKLPPATARLTPAEDTISMDITSAYNDPNLKKLVRTMHFVRKDGGSIEIDDQFDVAGPADIIESLPTHGTCRQIDARTLEFDYQNARLLVTVDAPVKFTITQTPLVDHGTAFTRVTAEMHFDKSGRVVMHMRATQ
jgi:hypothetical protein